MLRITISRDAAGAVAYYKASLEEKNYFYGEVTNETVGEEDSKSQSETYFLQARKAKSAELSKDKSPSTKASE